MSDGGNTVELGTICTSLIEAMEVINKIASKREVTEDELIKCELLSSQFKKDFGEELLSA